ncbi:MAG: phage portal protein [Fluviibacter sp.]
MSDWHQLMPEIVPGTQAVRSTTTRQTTVPTMGRGTRSVDAARVDRLTAQWMATSNSIDQELRFDLDRLRQRSRQQANSNDYVRKFLSMVARNVIGPTGFTLMCRSIDAPGKPDGLANTAIETHFARWARKGVCDISGRMSFADLQRAIVKAVARDGEALVLRIRGNGALNSYGYALQLLDIARLDTQMNMTTLRNGNSIVMGVEMNPAQRPVAYWLFEQNPGGPQGGSQHRRVLAEDVFHIYTMDRPEQTRGFPWLHTALLRLHNLKGYEEAAVIAARVGASKMGFFTTPDGDPSALAGGTDSNGHYVTEASPGTFDVLPVGVEFQSYNPDYPHQQYGEFVKAALRGISSGLDVSYNSLANDLEGVSYSSIRSGVLEERDQWMTLQGWFIEAFLIPVYEDWLQTALLNGAITQVNGSALPIAKIDKFMAHIWQGRRWQWVDPLKDIEAARLSIQTGVASPQMIAAQLGVDVEDMLDDIARFEQYVQQAGVSTVNFNNQPMAAPADTTA